MGRNLLTATFDAATELKDAGAVSATGVGTVNSVARVVNLGLGIALMTLVIDFDALDVSSGDERYEIILEGSTSLTFASDNHVLERVVLGDSTVNDETVDSTTGRITRRVANSHNGADPMPYVRIRHKIAGTTASVTYRAFLTKEVI